MWLRVSVLLCSLALVTCGSPSVHTENLAQRWSSIQASEACNTEIERKRWGSLLAILTYKQRERDHGYSTCMKSKLAGHG